MINTAPISHVLSKFIFFVLLPLQVACVSGNVGVTNTEPVVSFTQPADGQQFFEQESVVLTARVQDKEDPIDQLALFWTVSPNNLVLEQGTVVGNEVTLELGDYLPPGDYTVTLEAVDPRGDIGTDSVTFTVKKNEPPDVYFVAPVENELVAHGGALRVLVQVDDPDEWELNEIELDWGGLATEFSSTPSNPNSDGSAEFYMTGLDMGLYTLSVTATDMMGANDSDTILFEVVEGDYDQDGFIDIELGGDDCDDNDPTISPIADEYCDFIDNDCDGEIDEDSSVDAPIWYADKDSDGFGDEWDTTSSCTRPASYVEDSTDCEDNRSDAYPGAIEYCDGIDNDCNGQADEDEAVDASLWYADMDSDGYGDPDVTRYACVLPTNYSADNTDCDDTLASVYPSATEYCNGIDDNCDNSVDENSSTDAITWYNDADGDTFGDLNSTLVECYQPSNYVLDATDCDDTLSAVNPDALEECDSIDNDCDSTIDEPDAIDAITWYADLDGDTYGDASTSQVECNQPAAYVLDDTDCDDGATLVNPGAIEKCDGIDNDCDVYVDEDDAADVSTWYADADSDLYGDADVSIVTCYQPSGYILDNTDCDDADSDTYPSADEYCDGHDDDCDGDVDEDSAVDTLTWYLDVDSDGYGDPLYSLDQCYQPSNYVSDNTDCDPLLSNVNPGAVEYCDTYDNNCDGTVDEATAVDVSTWYADSDGDTYGDISTTQDSCSQPTNYVADDTDCDDTAVLINPASYEFCDGVDNDCDGDLDEASALDASTWYLDVDSDGYGNSTFSTIACNQPSYYVSDDTDCDDTDSTINPGATEYCDLIDNNCDGAIDEDSSASAATWYADVDSDGYGDSSSSILSCGQPSGYVSDSSDCDDAVSTTYPGADEYCDTVDNDCDTSIDESDALDALTWYADSDTDLYGDSSTSTPSCSQPTGYVSDDTDCDDVDSSINPSASEVCDSVDNDCDGDTDEASAIDALTWYADSDIDTYGDSSVSQSACSQPSGYVADATDCDDTESTTNPGAAEYCDGHDDNCDNVVDEATALDVTTWYRDADSDGYGDSATTLVQCYVTSGYLADSSDCDDSLTSVNPAADEYCDGIDNNCDNLIDDSTAIDATVWYTDADGDGYGVTSSSTLACTAPSGSVVSDNDCDDTDTSINPAGTEVCDGADNDCDGLTDDSSAIDVTLWYSDSDGDTYGDPDSYEWACNQPLNYVVDNTDCNDTTSLANPAGTEICGDGYDNDCDGSPGICSLTGDIVAAAFDAKMTGEGVNDYLGAAVAGVGDVNGDGLDDVIAGAYLEDYGGSSAGATYLMFGSMSGTTAASSADGKFYGESAGDRSGEAVAGGGDINDDNFDDILIGAIGDDDGGTDAGAAYLLLGPVTGSISLALNDAKLTGENAGDEAGSALSGVGDLDGDGNDDILVGAVGYSNSAGASYVVYGPVSGDLSLADAAAHWVGESSSDNSGSAVAGLGDWDADGLNDFIVGAYGNDDGGSAAGAAYIITDEGAGFSSLGSATVTLVGEFAGDRAGYSVDGAGDVNGDGYDDAIIGAYGDDTLANNGGAAYVVFGFSGSSADIDLSVADAKLIGPDASGEAGWSVAGLGDVEPDGYADIVVGAQGVNNKAGYAYIVYGDFSGTMILGEEGARIMGNDSRDRVGRAVAAAGDVDGDGYLDLLVGAQGDDEAGGDSGALYLFFGMEGM
jgi:hypothetical protein